VLVGHPSVSEAAAIGVPHEVKGSEVVCFCVLSKTEIDSDDLKEQLKARVADEMGKPLKPKEIIFVGDLPKTRNGKIMRRVIKKAFLGEDPGDISSLANPESVEEIVKLRKNS
jgi:acetyl-CoA synthetase